MGISLEAQTLIFLESILLGISLSILYDLLRAIRHTSRTGIFLTSLLDGFFWCAVLVAFFLFVIVIVQGEGRAYILLGAVLGAVLYYMTLSQLMLAIFSTIFRSIGRLFKTISQISHKIFGKIKCKFKKNKKCNKNIKKHFQFWRKRFNIK